MGFVEARMKTTSLRGSCRSVQCTAAGRRVPRVAAACVQAKRSRSANLRRRVVRVKAIAEEPQIQQVNTPLNGDPFVGMMETPVTSSPIVANYLSNLPAYRIAVSPLLRGVEIGLAHGFFIVGPFIKVCD